MFKFSKHHSINFVKLYKLSLRRIPLIRRIEEKRKTRKIYKIIKYASVLIIFIILLAGVYLAANYYILKSLYLNIISAKDNLTNAVDLIKIQEFKSASEFADRANQNFRAASSQAGRVKENFIFSNIDPVNEQFANLDHLLSSGEAISRAVKTGADFADKTEGQLIGGKKITYSKFSAEEKKRIIKSIYESGPDLVGMKANLDLALINLDQVRQSVIIAPFTDKINEAKDQVRLARDMLERAIPLSQVLPAFAGYPQKSAYLVLLQNNDELRPTGGFLGTYGILEVEHGDIVRFDTHDIYHMDMPVKDKLNIEPPAELKKYLGVDKWYMRDANWSPDWPESAKTIQSFYEKEDKLLTGKNRINNFDGSFQGVIGITPDLIVNLLRLTGPIAIEGNSYNADNFTKLLEYRVEKSYVDLGVPQWQRKEVIGEIFQELKIRLLDMPAGRWKEIIDLVENSFVRKDAIIYFNNPSFEDIILGQGWGGELKKETGDYLMVVDANMAAYKTDAVVDRSMQYQITETDGGLVARLNVKYAHRGQIDWRTTRYRTYTRVYVPAGSQLLRAGGADENVVTGKELGKTFFGAFLTVKPGQIGELNLEYKLPPKTADLIKDGKYRLIIQKQPGNVADSLKTDFSFKNKIKSFAPTGYYVNKENDRRIRWDTDLEADRRFEIIFK